MFNLNEKLSVLMSYRRDLASIGLPRHIIVDRVRVHDMHTTLHQNWLPTTSYLTCWYSSPFITVLGPNGIFTSWKGNCIPGLYHIMFCRQTWPLCMQDWVSLIMSVGLGCAQKMDRRNKILSANGNLVMVSLYLLSITSTYVTKNSKVYMFCTTIARPSSGRVLSCTYWLSWSWRC